MPSELERQWRKTLVASNYEEGVDYALVYSVSGETLKWFGFGQLRPTSDVDSQDSCEEHLGISSHYLLGQVSVYLNKNPTEFQTHDGSVVTTKECFPVSIEAFKKLESLAGRIILKQSTRSIAEAISSNNE